MAFAHASYAAYAVKMAQKETVNPFGCPVPNGQLVCPYSGTISRGGYENLEKRNFLLSVSGVALSPADRPHLLRAMRRRMNALLVLDKGGARG